jgi:hypothetical protein
MSAIPVTTIANRPAGQPVFDFDLGDCLCRVILSTIGNDGQSLQLTGWAYVIDENGVPVLDAATAAPIATTDTTGTIALSGVLAGTHALYDAWVRYQNPACTTLDADHLPDGWTSGAGAPSGTPAYGTGYYDTAAQVGYVYAQGQLNLQAAARADALAAQIDTAAKLAAIGL